MEEELRCIVCKQFYTNPVLLPCYHALCLACALHLQQPCATYTPSTQTNAESTAESIASGSSGDYPEHDTDKSSILSETDSGVVCSVSRPSSYVGSPNNGFFALHLTCPTCAKPVYFDESGAHNLPRYRVMQAIVERMRAATAPATFQCQMCVARPQEAVVECEQCRILYCEGCRESCHPLRGPLATHCLVAPSRRGGRGEGMVEAGRCAAVGHGEEPLTMYCAVCKCGMCRVCVTDGKHPETHEVAPIAATCKVQKAELSHNLQQLSERAKTTTAFIQRLKCMSGKVAENCADFETVVTAQCDTLIEAIYQKRNQLLDCIRKDKEMRIRILKDQVTACTNRLQYTTAVLQFCIEALKETDSTAFLQVGPFLSNRVVTIDRSWDKEWSVPQVSPTFDLNLDDQLVVRAIEQLNFIQMKPPASPAIMPEECSAENNSVTVAWRPPLNSHVEGFVLELDDGMGGEFRAVYCGLETICTIDGLHFNSLYNARVKAFNGCGEGDYSELIGLQTAEVAWFTFDPVLSASGLQFNETNTEVTGDGWEQRVVLGNVGFSRGVHYWEFTINKFDTDTDPAFGIARIDVCRDKMLGKDDKGWAMYIDRQRSWFQHAGTHEQRINGGISNGSTIGVLLDLNKHILLFYVNDEPQGSIAFSDLYGVFYPALSINRGVNVSLHAGLDAPSDFDEN